MKRHLFSVLSHIPALILAFSLLLIPGEPQFSQNTGYKILMAEEVMERIGSGEILYLIDCRPPEEFNAGHIPGAYQMDTGSFGEEELAFLPTDQQIVIYCFTGQTSSQLTSYLNVLGYNAYSLKFGLNSITDDPAVLNNPSTGNPVVYAPPATDYPVVTGP